VQEITVDGQTVFTAGATLPQIASLAHHYDATKISGSDGDPIGSWTDQEGSDNLTENTSSKKPTLRTNGINGKQILEFDGSDDMLTASFGTTITQPDQIFTVAKKRSSGSSSRETIHETSTNPGRQLLDSDGDSTWRIFAGNNLDSGTNDDTSAHVYTTLYNGSNSVLRRDGVQIASGNAGTEDLPSFRVGADHSPAHYGDYDIAEILIYDADLSDSDRDGVESYLGDKWGISV
jgi:hypothetical protein